MQFITLLSQDDPSAGAWGQAVASQRAKAFLLRDKADAMDTQAIWIAARQPHILPVPVKSEPGLPLLIGMSVDGRSGTPTSMSDTALHTSSIDEDSHAQFEEELNCSDSVYVGIHELPLGSPSFRPRPHFAR